MKLRGIVRSGAGGAGNPNNPWFSHLMDVRTTDFGFRPEPGTLNVTVLNPDFGTKLMSLGAHKASCDARHDVKGYMFLWRGLLRHEGKPPDGVECWVLRHERAQHQYVELMGRVKFRTALRAPATLDNDDTVEIEIVRLDGSATD